jgi:hypothetical protein
MPGELFPISTRHALEAPRFEAVLACVVSPSLTACPARSHGVRALPPRHRRDSTDPPTPSTRTTHTPSTRLAGRRRRAVVELRVARHPFGILAEPRLKRALARRLLLPRLGLARAPRRVPPLASYKFLEVDRGPADGLLLGLWRRPVCFTCLHAVDASLAVHAWHSRRPHAIEALRLSLSCLSAPLRHRRYGVLHAIDATGPPRNRRDAPRHRRDASLATGRGARTVVAAAARPNAPSLRRTSRPGPASCARRRP